MKSKLSSFFNDKEIKKEPRDTINYKTIYITDSTSVGGSGIIVSSSSTTNINSCKLQNNTSLNIHYYIFANYSFLHENPANTTTNPIGFERYNSSNPTLTKCYKNCECILFPDGYQETKKKQGWVILVEAKYTNDYDSAKMEHNGETYPNKAIRQIISTAEYLRRHKIIPKKKKITGIITLPNLFYQSDIASLFVGGIYIDNEKILDINKSATSEKMSLNQIEEKYRIVIEPRNIAEITDAYNLQFND